jgi:hypothetical protein
LYANTGTYHSGGTIESALGKIASNQYVLPAIQREFVWKPEQIEKLFDSLMQGYPFGTFLFWSVRPETSDRFKFYKFMLHYHQRDQAHCEELGLVHNQAVTAVLDGQQRLTALNIGLRGSMTMKQPNKWWNNPDAFRRRALHLNLLADQEPDEDGIVYEFRFRDEKQEQSTEGEFWFRVGEILKTKDIIDFNDMLVEAGFSGDQHKRALRVLSRLHRVMHVDPLIHYYEEEAQDVERVLNIFIRLNSGGTVLSYSDLLLSIAVAQWKSVDARSAIHRLVDDLNKIGTGFALSQDFVLKAGLMLSDIASVGFKVENFTAANMGALETNWLKIRDALVRTVELAASFGLNGQTLRADSALLPIAYYLYQRGSPDNYVTNSQFASDRGAIRDWLMRSLLKASGIWGSGLDILLTALRTVIKEEGSTGFPYDRLSERMAARGKSIDFTGPEVEEMLGMQYGDRRLFPLMVLLFPFVDLRNQFHLDHIFPISRFSAAKLKKAGIAAEDHDRLGLAANSLANIQLLDGPANVDKRAALPSEWMKTYFNDPDQQCRYVERHLLGGLPESLDGVEDFWKQRRIGLQQLIQMRLGVSAASAMDTTNP